MNCAICSTDLDETDEREKIPIAPSAERNEFTGPPVCDTEPCRTAAHKKARDQHWTGFVIHSRASE